MRLYSHIVTSASLKFNLIASRMKFVNYLIYIEGNIILYYDIVRDRAPWPFL